MFVIQRAICSFLLKQVRTYALKPKNHYESLGISPSSTQGEVKNAYYKLSMVYHPDKNQGNVEYAKRFRDISEAYEVLGNVKSRKLYDRGLHIGINPISHDDTPYSKFHQSRPARSRPPTPSGRVPIYDFDEWSKNHYGRLFRQRQENMRRTAGYKKDMQDEVQTLKTDRMLIFFCICGFLWAFCSEKGYDEVIVGKKPHN